MSTTVSVEEDESKLGRVQQSQVSPEEIEKLVTKIAALEKSLHEEGNEIKKDFMIILGLFAALLAFLDVGVKVFDHTLRYSYVIGTISFLLACILMFALALRSVFVNTVWEGWKVYLHPVVVLIFSFLVISGASFWYGMYHTSLQFNIHTVTFPLTVIGFFGLFLIAVGGIVLTKNVGKYDFQKRNRMLSYGLFVAGIVFSLIAIL